MAEITLLAIDLAKNVFQIHGVDGRGRKVLGKRVSRQELARFMANMKPCVVAMEACSGAHCWARVFRSQGHEVRLIAAQFVRPFVKSNKTDAADAEAIAEAVQRPSMRFVPVKEVFHQDLQALHRVRSRVVSERVRLIQEIHGLLHEYGLVMPRPPSKFRGAVAALLDPADSSLTPAMKELVGELAEELRELDRRVDGHNRRLKRIAGENEASRRLCEIPGVGPLIATAVVAAVVDSKEFRSGRHMAAWLGLVPRQHSSGGKERLLGISKRGDPYLRQIIIHGARTVVYHCAGKEDRFNSWIRRKEQERGRNKTVVAVANRNVRVMWALLSRGERYRIVA